MWHARLIERRIAGFYDDVRPGPARTINDERVAQRINTRLHTKPANGLTPWSVHSVAALNMLNGAVLAACKPRYSHQKFLAFLREIDKVMPAELDIHCICDNYATHSHLKTQGMAGH